LGIVRAGIFYSPYPFHFTAQILFIIRAMKDDCHSVLIVMIMDNV